MILTENARVRLRTMRREDLDELYTLLSDAAVIRWLELLFSRTQTEDFFGAGGTFRAAARLRRRKPRGRIPRLCHLP